MLIDNKDIFQELLELPDVEELGKHGNDRESGLQDGFRERPAEELIVFLGFVNPIESYQKLIDVVGEMLQDLGVVNLENLGLGENELGVQGQGVG